jgi:hypothetical protein
MDATCIAVFMFCYHWHMVMCHLVALDVAHTLVLAAKESSV